MSWSDGGGQTHDIIATGASTFGATFQPVSADVGLTQSAQSSPGRVSIGFDVSNAGPATATSVVVTDTLPSKVSYVSATGGAGSCVYRSSDRTVVCTLGTIASGAQVSVTIVTSNTQKGTITNVAKVTATSPDLNLANNSAGTAIRLR